MTEVEDALSQIAQIRAQLAIGTRFRGYAPEVLFVAAGLSMLAALVQMVWPERFATDALGYVTYWGTVLGGIGMLVFAEAIPRTRNHHGEAAIRLLGSSLRLILPFAAAQAVIALVVCRYAPESTWLVPGLWLIVTALLASSAVPNLPSAILWVALWYFISGVAVLLAAGRSHTLTPWMLGAPFALGNLAIALILSRSARKEEYRA